MDSWKNRGVAKTLFMSLTCKNGSMVGSSVVLACAAARIHVTPVERFGAVLNHVSILGYLVSQKRAIFAHFQC